MASRHFTINELNKAALNHFVCQPVSREMVSFLAEAAHNVVPCDSTLMPPSSSSKHQHLLPTPPRSSELRTIRDVDDILPTLEEFITQLVVSSNVQVLTLISTLVYLTRLKSKLQPMARGLRCSTCRIFLASLILAAKYLNDSPPKNKHRVKYNHINTDMYSFGFNRTEVNLMEKQLLFLLEWELRITEQDLYWELDSFLAPLRVRIAERHARKMRQLEEKMRKQEIDAVTTRCGGPVSFKGLPRARDYVHGGAPDGRPPVVLDLCIETET
ncbi:PHO85 cyclin-1 [Tolypocladium ophioglossoides CBS 100239]|uniref:PHO85 cyclin-1 n=1 Tax=Tolypocladium ophioglossoides (strain CBS 100239) TaxID=1163406 RepID=A0A0L0MWH8_TOLOC|nr:PHO85 cyclin-1 [Tolypocladium ophioglossoides CBS 100239]